MNRFWIENEDPYLREPVTVHPMPTCETCDIRTDCFLEQSRHGKIWAMTNFCSLHQDFRGSHA